MSLVDLIRRLGLQMLPLDREPHEIQTVHKLTTILIDALRHSCGRFIRSRLDEPLLLQYSYDSDTAKEWYQSSEEYFASVRDVAVTIILAFPSHPCNKQLKMRVFGMSLVLRLV